MAFATQTRPTRPSSPGDMFKYFNSSELDQSFTPPNSAITGSPGKLPFADQQFSTSTTFLPINAGLSSSHRSSQADMTSANDFTTVSESINSAPAWSASSQHINPQVAFGTTDPASWPSTEPPSYPRFEGRSSANVHLGQLTPPNDDANGKDRANAQVGYAGNEDCSTHHTEDDDQEEDSEVEAASKKRKGRPKDPKSVKRRKSDVVTQEDESKRKKFLERNRQAASKCRQKKRAYNEKLEGRCREMMRENVNLRTLLVQLKDEVLNLQNLALEHGNMGCQEVAAHMTRNMGLESASAQALGSSSPGHGQSTAFSSSSLPGQSLTSTSPIVKSAFHGASSAHAEPNGQRSYFPLRHDSLMQGTTSRSTAGNQGKLSLVEQYNRSVGPPQQSPVQTSHQLSHMHHHQQPSYAVAPQNQARRQTPPSEATRPYAARSPPTSCHPSQQRIDGLPDSAAFGSDGAPVRYHETISDSNEQDQRLPYA